jgi:hypothetical protein
MNLSLVHELLVAADQQPHGFLQIRGPQADREVRLMAAAGLVEATLSDSKGQLFTSINRLTDSGHSFLRAFTKTRFRWPSSCAGAGDGA